MTIKSIDAISRGKTQINLTGPEGNIFYLIRVAKHYAKHLNLDFDQIQKEMMSSDYENAIQTFDRYFGDYIDLYR